MGRPKLLLPWGQTSVVGHLIRQWGSLHAKQIAVVCGGSGHSLEAELDRLGFPGLGRIQNPAPDRGMFSSIQCAAQWRGWKGALTHWAIVLGDQPHLRPATLRAVVDCAAAHPGNVVQPALGGRRRHPVLLPKAVFAELAVCSARNLKDFLLGRELALCECGDPGLELDIDRPADYEQALALVFPSGR
jgi:molybdenum cofactor cytidylyltransferase